MTDSSAAPDVALPAGQTLGDLVYDGLKLRILHHGLRMGDPLREDEVASWFSASRLPAREALKRLELEGLVERSGRKYLVRSYSPDEIVVTYRIRAALEHLAAELAIRNWTAEREAVIARHLDRQLEVARGAAAAERRGAFSDLDKEFHLSLAAVSGNAPLLRELELVMNRVTLIRSHEIDIDSGPLAAYGDHCRIFDAIRRRDTAVACAELDYHYATTLRLHRIGLAAPIAPQHGITPRHTDLDFTR